MVVSDDSVRDEEWADPHPDEAVHTAFLLTLRCRGAMVDFDHHTDTSGHSYLIGKSLLADIPRLTSNSPVVGGHLWSSDASQHV